MGVFIFIFISLFIIHFIMDMYSNSRSSRKTARKVETFLCFMLLWLVQGLRHESIGFDSREAYRPFFDMISGLSLFDFKETFFAFEPGFVFLSKLIRFFTTDPQIYILICSFISIAPIAYLFYKHSTNISFSFLAFGTLILYHFGFSGIRQAIAIAITAISFEFILKKKLILFIATVLLAFTIHTSALFFIVTYPVYWYLKLDKKRLIIILTVFALVLTVLRPVAELVLNVFFAHDVYLNKLNNAVDNPSYNMIIIFLAILFFTYTVKDDIDIKPYRSLLMMAVTMQSLALITTTGARMALYYIPYVSIAIPLVLKEYKIETRRFASIGIAAFLIFFFFYVNAGGYLDVIPYKFFWQN